MQFWYSENHTPQVKLSINVDRHIYSGKSGFQRIDVFESGELGRFFTLDGFMMMTQKDEFIYHEMITHVPMAVMPDAKNVLVIGGGDGGTVRELTRYKTIESIDLVEIDAFVVEVCKEYFPSPPPGLDDERVRIFYEDGSEYIKNIINHYDIIIVDSTDPFGPGEELFTKEFYENCHKALTDRGIMVNQHESAFYDEDIQIMQRTHTRISGTFRISEVYQAHIPTYSSGYWLFGFASKQLHPVLDLDTNAWNALGIKTAYYNTPLHIGAFALPNYVMDLLRCARENVV